MPAHKFMVGQKVAFRPEERQFANRREVFIVVRQLPETGGMFQYQQERDGRPRARGPGNSARRFGIGILMRSKRQQQQSTRRIRRDRRRLGRFVFFAEIEADLTPIALFDQPSVDQMASASQTKPGGLRENGDA